MQIGEAGRWRDEGPLPAKAYRTPQSRTFAEFLLRNNAAHNRRAGVAGKATGNTPVGGFVPSSTEVFRSPRKSVNAVSSGGPALELYWTGLRPSEASGLQVRDLVS